MIPLLCYLTFNKVICSIPSFEVLVHNLCHHTMLRCGPFPVRSSSKQNKQRVFVNNSFVTNLLDLLQNCYLQKLFDWLIVDHVTPGLVSWVTSSVCISAGRVVFCQDSGGGGG